MKQSHRIPLIILTTHRTRKWQFKSQQTDESKSWMMDKHNEVKIGLLEETNTIFFFFFKVEPIYSCLGLSGMPLHRPCQKSPLVLCFKQTPLASERCSCWSRPKITFQTFHSSLHYQAGTLLPLLIFLGLFLFTLLSSALLSSLPRPCSFLYPSYPYSICCLLSSQFGQTLGLFSFMRF